MSETKLNLKCQMSKLKSQNDNSKFKKNFSLPHLFPPPPRGRGRIRENPLSYPPPPFGRGRKKVGEGILNIWILVIVSDFVLRISNLITFGFKLLFWDLRFGFAAQPHFCFKSGAGRASLFQSGSVEFWHLRFYFVSVFGIWNFKL